MYTHPLVLLVPLPTMLSPALHPLDQTPKLPLGLPSPTHLRPPPLRRENYQPYRFGHLAFKYIEDEMERKKAASNGNNGTT